VETDTHTDTQTHTQTHKPSTVTLAVHARRRLITATSVSGKVVITAEKYYHTKG